jgi:hypothetical protein
MNPANWVQTSDLSQWFIDVGASADNNRSAGTRSMVMLTAWDIWKERNARVFNKVSRSPNQVFRSIQEEARVWVRAGNRAVESCLVATTAYVN